MSARGGPPLPWLVLVTDHTVCEGGYAGLERAVAAALEGGVNVVQLREKALPADELLVLAQRLRRLTRDAEAALLVNDRVDVALAAEADGVHLGGSGLPVPVGRALIGEGLVSRSVHSVLEAVEAEQLGADVLVLGTIFPSESHPGRPAAGPHLIKKVRQRVTVPIVAIGGLTPENAPQAIADGASGIAVIRSILADPSPKHAAQRLSARIAEAWPSAVLHRDV